MDRTLLADLLTAQEEESRRRLTHQPQAPNPYMQGIEDMVSNWWSGVQNRGRDIAGYFTDPGRSVREIGQLFDPEYMATRRKPTVEEGLEVALNFMLPVPGNTIAKGGAKIGERLGTALEEFGVAKTPWQAQRGAVGDLKMKPKEEAKLFRSAKEDDPFFQPDYPGGFRVFKGTRFAHYDKEGNRVMTGGGLSQPTEEELAQFDELVKGAATSPLTQLPENLYIRFGDLPKGGVSKHWQTGAKEKGLSVYPAQKTWKHGGVWFKEGAALPAAALLRMSEGAPIYLMTGKKVGIGSDLEPVIKNAKVVGRLKLNPQENVESYDIELLQEQLSNLLEGGAKPHG